LKHRTRAGLPHRHVTTWNIRADLGAGMSWFLAATMG
jgi:hypothetical protein